VPVLDDFESEDVDEVEDELVELDDFASEVDVDVDDFEDDAGELLDEELRLSLR
jgi:hypothetical protein